MLLELYNSFKLVALLKKSSLDNENVIWDDLLAVTFNLIYIFIAAMSGTCLRIKKKVILFYFIALELVLLHFFVLLPCFGS